MKKLLLILLLLLLPITARAEAPVTSVVHLYALGYDDQGAVTGQWTGSSFPVGTVGEESDIFLTNCHVVTGNGKYDAEHVKIWILKDGTDPRRGGGIPCRILATGPDYPDVAVLQAEQVLPGCTALALVSSRRIPNGTEVTALGYPGMAQTRYGSGPEDVIVTRGTIRSRQIMTHAGSTWSLLHTAPLRHGSSGGPLITDSGAVAGLNTYGLADDNTLFCAVFTDYAMELLDSLGISYDTAPGRHPMVVLVLNTLHLPTLPDAAAWAVFALAVMLAAVSVFQILREILRILKHKNRQKSGA